MDDEELDTELAVQRAASIIGRAYHRYVERDDLVQEGRLWVLQNPGRIEGFQQMDSTRAGQRFLNKSVLSCVVQYARREKAAILGYSVEDETVYQRGMISSVLPDVFLGPGYGVTDTEVSAPGDPAEGGGQLTMILDVARAWESAPLTRREREFVYLAEVEGVPQSEIVSQFGVTQPYVSKVIRNGLDKMADFLNGLRDDPLSFKSDPRLTRRPGVRKANQGIGQVLS